MITKNQKKEDNMYYVLYWNIDRFEVVKEEFTSHEAAQKYRDGIESCHAIVVKKCD